MEATPDWAGTFSSSTTGGAGGVGGAGVLVSTETTASFSGVVAGVSGLGAGVNVAVEFLEVLVSIVLGSDFSVTGGVTFVV